MMESCHGGAELAGTPLAIGRLLRHHFGMQGVSGRRIVLLVLGGLMLLHVLPYPFATVLLDTSRDLSQAWDIVQGGAAWLGPRIDDRVHLGPLWFWLLAPVLGVTHSVAATLAFEGALAALKFPLAYACGKRLLDARFGLLWALALALPGWNALQPMFPTHTNLAEATMLAALLALIRLWQQGAARGWCAYGLLQGLALHAHPSTALLLPAAAAVAWQRRAQWRSDWTPLILGVALAVLPFLPMLWHEAAHGWPTFAAMQREGGSEWRAVAGAFALARGVFVYGPMTAFAAGDGGMTATTASAAESSSAPAVAAWALIALTTLSLIGWRWAVARRRALWRVPLCMLLAFLLLAALRERTPFYMVYAWLPFGAALLAGAWWALWDLPRLRVLAWSAAAACGAGALFAAAVQLRAAHDGVGLLPAGSVADVRRDPAPRNVPLLPAFVLDRWGREVCARQRPVVLHGDLALLVDAALAMPARMACDGADQVRIGGGARFADAWHVAGLTPGQWRRVEGVDGGWPQAFSESPWRVVAASGTTPVASGGLLALRERSTEVLRTRELEFSAPRDAALSIGLPFAPYDEARIESVQADGSAREPLLMGATSQVYRCDDCSGAQVQWRVVLRTREPERLDVVLLKPAAAVSRD
jgi:hypothetical protein